MIHKSQPEVHILMGTYNGDRFLDAQLESLRAQTHQNWRLTCSDDGSNDNTVGIMQRFSASSKQTVTIVSGPRRGFSENFLSLIRRLDDTVGLIAFADQDDIWLPDKLERAIARINQFSPEEPVLYGSATWIWDSERGHRRATPVLHRELSFRNALVENFASGNTMVFNGSAAQLLRDASRRIGPVYAHDWWSYALMTGSGARIIYDETPSVLYRQHRQNEIGAGETFWKRQRRNLAVADGRYRIKVGQNLIALSTVSDLLTLENASLIFDFIAARDQRFPLSRLRQMWKIGVYRQSISDMMGFWGAVLLGKV